MEKIQISVKQSQKQAKAWGDLLVETFLELRITQTQAIRCSHVGRATYYNMKEGKIINIDAYLRFTQFVVWNMKKKSASLLPTAYGLRWRERLMEIILPEEWFENELNGKD